MSVILASGRHKAINTDQAPLVYGADGRPLNSMTTARLLGRGSSGTGNVEEISLAGGLSMSGTVLSSSGSQRSTFDTPPSSPSAYDDEFDVTTIDAGWTLTAGLDAGAINPTATLATDAVYDLTSWPGYLLFQGHNAATTTYTMTKSITLDTSCTLFFFILAQSRGATGGAAAVSAADEATIGVRLDNDGDTNEYVEFELRSPGGAAPVPRFNVSNNGVVTTISAGARGAAYVAIWKSTNTYHCAVMAADGNTQYYGSTAKTGVTTLNRLMLRFTTADESPSLIQGISFVRYYNSLTLAFRHT